MASVRSTRDAISDTAASYATPNEQGARKKVLDNRQRTAVNRAGMGKSPIIGLLIGLALAFVRFADAQQPAKVPKIGWLGALSPASDAGRELLGREIRALGYVDGKNIAIEYRYAGDKLDRLPALADELVRLKVDVILATATPVALAAKNATTTIPIVFLNVPDPVAAGLVDSLARPGETSRESPPLRRCWPVND